jgi:hypothetical protein
LSYVSQGFSTIKIGNSSSSPSSSKNSTSSSNTINIETMALMEKELEAVLTEREGYRNRVRALEIALTETSMECDRLTWKALPDESSSSGDSIGKNMRKNRSLDTHGDIIQATGVSPRRRVVSPVEGSKKRQEHHSKESKKNQSPSRSSHLIGHEKHISRQMVSNTRNIMSSEKSSELQSVKETVTSSSPTTSEVVVERALQPEHHSNESKKNQSPSRSSNLIGHEKHISTQMVSNKRNIISSEKSSVLQSVKEAVTSSSPTTSEVVVERALQTVDAARSLRQQQQGSSTMEDIYL